MIPQQTLNDSLRIGNDTYDHFKGDIHNLSAFMSLVNAVIADRITEEQGTEAALHYALHLQQAVDNVVEDSHHNVQIDKQNENTAAGAVPHLELQRLLDVLKKLSQQD